MIKLQISQIQAPEMSCEFFQAIKHCPFHETFELHMPLYPQGEFETDLVELCGGRNPLRPNRTMVREKCFFFILQDETRARGQGPRRDSPQNTCFGISLIPDERRRDSLTQNVVEIVIPSGFGILGRGDQRGS